MTRPRLVYIGFGLIFVLVALWLPTDLYDHLPKPKGDFPEPPISGVTLVRLCFGLEALWLLMLGLTGGVRLRLRAGEYLTLPGPEEGASGNLRHPLAWVVAVTVVAAVLRLYSINSELWLDEITTVLDYRAIPPFDVVAAYSSSNNHLLNTLLIKMMVNAVGPAEWAIRLPAAIFGIASIPVQYALARLALSQRASLLASLLLAVSYHHVFFSQNARGYTGMLFFSLLGTLLFLKAVSGGGPRYWVLYVGAMFLSVATVLYGAFIIAGHLLTIPIVCWMLVRQGKPFLPLLRAAAASFTVLGLLVFHLYASAIPQVYVYIRSVYRTDSAGYSALSNEFLTELVRGLSAGYGGIAILLALVAMILVSPGLVSFVRRHPLYCLTLSLPMPLAFALLAGTQLSVSPRFFLWALPVGLILAVGTLASLGRTVYSQPRLQAITAKVDLSRAGYVCAGLLVALSLASLPQYYATPKQPNRQSLEWLLNNRVADDVIVTAWLARWGPRFYGPPLGLEEGKSFYVVETADDIRGLEAQYPSRNIWVLTTLTRALKLEHPDLDSYIRTTYRAEMMFPATVGDAQITVWKRASPVPPQAALQPQQ